MAASVKNMVRMSDDKSSSSSDDDEALKRCQEAVWESRTVKVKEEDKAKESKRVVVADHEHDGNELQVSKGFQTHVAKKLGNFLDSCISETQTTSSSCVASAKCDDEAEGFRLFSTSVPGQTEEPPAPVRRRPVPSSSDSDSEMESRLREAAVSIKDLLPSVLAPSSAPQPPGSGKIKKKKKKNAAEEEEEECPIVKKKKKRRRTGEESMQVDCAHSVSTESIGEPESSEQEHSQVKVKPKKKKKKRCEGNTMD